MGIFRKPEPQAPMGPRAEWYDWNELVNRTIRKNGMNTLFKGRSDSGPVKVMLSDLRDLVYEVEFNSFTRNLVPKYSDMHIGMLHDYIEMKLNDIAYIRDIEHNKPDWATIIYDNDDVGKNVIVKDIISRVNTAFNSATDDLNKLLKSLHEKWPNDAVEISEEYGILVAEVNDFLNNLKKRIK